MSQPWSEELIAKLGITDIVRLRAMHKTEARKYLLNKYQLSPYELEQALGITKPDEQINLASAMTDYQKKLQGDMRRAVFCAAAWIAGASWQQLGSLFGVQRQSIMSSVGRILAPGTRQSMRISAQAPSLETLSAWLNWFQAKDDVLNKPILEIATMLLTIVDE